MEENIKPRKNVYPRRPTSEVLHNESPSGSEAHNTSTDSEEEPEAYKENYVNHDTKSYSFQWEWFILVAVGIIISVVYQYVNKGVPNHEVDKKAKFQVELQDIREKFPNQNDKLWHSFNSGITTIQPSVFLLLHSGENHASKCLVKKVADSAVKFLSNSSTEPIFIHGEEMKQNTEFINDYGLFLKSYQADLERRNVMVIFNLQDIPPVIAQAFHSLCDTDNPLVKEAAYVFTLKVSGEYNHKPRTVAETELKSLWKNFLDIDVMEPLIIRIANIVLFVEPERDTVCS